MGRIFYVRILILVTLPAAPGPLVLDLEILPDLLIPLAVPAVHVSAFMDTEIRRYGQLSDQQDDGNHQKRQIKRSPNMILQDRPPFARLRGEYSVGSCEHYLAKI